MKRTPVLRRTRLRRFTPLRAKYDPALPKTGKPSRLGKSIPLRVRRQVKARADGRCEVCGCGGPDHLHHRKLRSQGGQHTAENLLHIHHGCHDDIHRNPERSYALGHLVRAWMDPADVPVTLLPKIRSL